MRIALFAWETPRLGRIRIAAGSRPCAFTPAGRAARTACLNTVKAVWSTVHSLAVGDVETGAVVAGTEAGAVAETAIATRANIRFLPPATVLPTGTLMSPNASRNWRG